MTRPIRRRFWLEAVLSGAALVLAIVTLFSKEWIEEVFHVDPDGGNGALEWLIVVGLAVVAVVCGVLARREATRPAPA
jgi:uncharacterized membrane protein YcjF (UPF0283 family)